MGISRYSSFPWIKKINLVANLAVQLITFVEVLMFFEFYEMW